MPREFLPLLGDPDDVAEAARLRGVRLLLLGYGALRGWVSLAAEGGAGIPLVPGFTAAALQTIALVLLLRPAGAWLAPRVALPAVLLQIGLSFPETANPVHLEALALSLLCVVRRDDAASEALALRALRGLALVVLFQMGLQNLLYGHYLHGDFLAYRIGRGDPFAGLLRFALPPGEIARLAGYDPTLDGAGPYRVDAPLFVALSNGVWLAEIVLSLGLAWRRTRALAAAAGIVLVLGIQFGARELDFALVLGVLLAASLPLPAWLRSLARDPEAEAGEERRGARRAPARSAAPPGTARHFASAVLLFAALWPLAHRGLVARYRIDPSKFAGWAANATPVVPEIAVLFVLQGKGLTVLDERSLPPHAREELERFRKRRTAWGELAAPDDLARAVFEARGDLAWLLVATQRLRLDPRSARMTSERGQKIYQRADVMK